MNDEMEKEMFWGKVESTAKPAPDESGLYLGSKGIYAQLKNMPTITYTSGTDGWKWKSSFTEDTPVITEIIDTPNNTNEDDDDDFTGI
jgi:hypothetical protein